MTFLRGWLRACSAVMAPASISSSRDLADTGGAMGNQIGAAVAHVDNIPISVVLNHAADNGRTHSVKFLVEMGILEGDAVCLGAGGFQNAFIIHTARQAGGEFGIDIGDKGLVGKLACDAARLCAAHSVAQRGDQAAFGLALFENEAILIVLADRALVCHAEAFHADPCPPFCDFCIFLLS